jgi:hypothetical protein
LSGNCIINGDIDGGDGIAIDVTTKFFPKSIVHNGNATNNGNKSLVDFGADTPSFWSGGVANVKLNGEYKSANEKVINVRGENNNKIHINGRIESDYAGVGNNYGVFIQDNVSDSNIFESCVVIMTANGTPECVGSDIAKNIKIFRDLGSNVNAGANISKLIVANNLTVDTDFE